MSAIFKEFDEESARVRGLLRDEFNRHAGGVSPWDCTERDCPYVGNPMIKSCGCYREATKKHIAAVLLEINKS